MQAGRVGNVLAIMPIIIIGPSMFPRLWSNLFSCLQRSAAVL